MCSFGSCRTLLGLEACFEGWPFSGRDFTPDVASDRYRRAPSGASSVVRVWKVTSRLATLNANHDDVFCPFGCRAARCWKETSGLPSLQRPSCLMQRRGPEAPVPCELPLLGATGCTSPEVQRQVGMLPGLQLRRGARSLGSLCSLYSVIPIELCTGPGLSTSTGTPRCRPSAEGGRRNALSRRRFVAGNQYPSSSGQPIVHGCLKDVGDSGCQRA